ncbi:MAG: hypothetical protein JNM84_10965 [Planctomycetes bacterium]|nr:hypothetical protein [Planctomycetota bacterium]
MDQLARRFVAVPSARRLPGVLAAPLAAFAVCAWLVLQASWTALAHTGVLVLVGSALYGVTNLRRPRSSVAGTAPTTS